MESNDIIKSTSALAIRDVDDLGRVGKMLAVSGYFDDAKDVAQASVKVLAGMEMGFGPFTSMTGIHIIKGKPSVGANLMAAAVKANPRYDYRVRKMEDSEVIVEFFEMVNGKWESIGKSSFTAADAQKAGTQNMGRFPRNMLFARAISNGIKWFCPDVFNGNAAYTPDELGAVVDDDGNVIELPVTQTQAIETPVVTNPQPEPEAEKPAEKKAFDEEEFLRNFSQPAAVAKMSYNNALNYGSDKTGQKYDEMTTKDLYCHWLGLSKKLRGDVAPDQKDAIGLKISAICAILWHRHQELTIPVTKPDPFVNPQ